MAEPDQPASESKRLVRDRDSWALCEDCCRDPELFLTRLRLRSFTDTGPARS